MASAALKTDLLRALNSPDAFSRDLATAINKVLDNPELAEAMAAAGQKRAREVFSWSSIAQQTKKLYDSLVK